MNRDTRLAKTKYSLLVNLKVNFIASRYSIDSYTSVHFIASVRQLHLNKLTS